LSVGERENLLPISRGSDNLAGVSREIGKIFWGTDKQKDERRESSCLLDSASK